jgi:hypothetical protein
MIVKQTKPFVTYVDDKFFYPGMNTFDDVASAALLANDSFLAKVKAGQLEIIGKDSDPVKKVETTSAKAAVVKVSVSGLAIAAAVKVIEGTFNVAALKDLASVDQRKGIQDAIAKQLRKIDDQNVPSGKKEEE